MDKESLNYIRRLRSSPPECFRALPYYFSLAKRKLLEREHCGMKYYPEAVVSAYMDIKSNRDKSYFNASYLSIYRDLHLTAVPLDNSIMLADGIYRFADLPNWHEQFFDSERTESLHRWIWLLIKFFENPSLMLGQWGVTLMTDWIARMKDKRCKEAWNTYTAGERICNGLIFLSLTGQWSRDNNMLLSELKNTALYVSENLEYKYQGVVFNHILNNARALYFAGVYFNIKAFKNLAETVFNSEVDKIVNYDGFLREGSSHYQFMIARWFLEICHLAEVSGDYDFHCTLSEITRNILSRCWFFLVYDRHSRNWGIPLIGDVSPDFAPEWLIPVPWSASAVELYRPETIPAMPEMPGWLDIFPAEDATCRTLCGNGIFGDRSFHAYHESGWFRLDFGVFTVFWHIEPTGSPMFPSHAHCDTGSFVLYIKGEIFLMDPGRFNYLDNDEGYYGISACAHNNLAIDGMEPFVYKSRTRYPDFYRKTVPTLDYSWTDAGFELILRHNGFGRIFGDEIKLERIFKIGTDTFEIEDIIVGQREHDIDTYFQWGTTVKLSEMDGGGTFRLSECNTGSAAFFCNCRNIKTLSLNSAVANGSFSGWFYPSYGRKEAATTLMVKQRAKLPIRNNYVLSVKL